jgi:hypothetical protein
LISWIRTDGKTIEHLALVFALTSAAFLNRHFYLQTTFNKLQIFTMSPDVSKCVVDVMDLIDNKANDISIKFIENENNKDLNKSITFLLGLCDDMGSAIKENIISNSIVYKLQGQFILKVYLGLLPYITELSKKGQGSYPGLEYLHKKWSNK